MNLSISGDASSLVRKSTLRKPCVKVNLEYKPPVCTSSFCRKRPYVSVSIVEENSVNEGFVRVVTVSSIPVYFARPLFELAEREGRPVNIDARGGWKFRRLVVEGLDPYKL